MIYATGYVTIITNPTLKPKTQFKRNTLSLKIIETEEIEGSQKVKYEYTAFLPRSYECQFLEDYTGKLKPFIERHISERVVSLQVTHLNYVSEQAMRRMTQRKW